MGDCPSLELLLSYVLGVQEPDKVVPTVIHLGSCERCRKEVRAIRRGLEIAFQGKDGKKNQ